MKKIVIFFIVIIVVICGISYMYMDYKANNKSLQKENSQFEKYVEKEIYGTELATIMNKAIDLNTKNEVPKDDKGTYIENEENSIKIQIKITDNGKIYDMETFDQSGMNQFVTYYGTIKFKGMEIQYHQKTQKVKYLLFEQITQ